MLISVSEKTIGVTPGPETITLRLFVWIEDNEVHYVYGPSGPVKFSSESTSRLLKIILVPDSTTVGADRFHISHFTTTKLSKIKAIKKKDAGGTDIPHNDKEDSTITGGTKEISFDLDMKKGDSIYLNVLLKDTNTANGKRLISCDPQVENGTKT